MIFEHIFHEIALFATLPATGKVIFAGGNPFFYDFFYGEKSKYDFLNLEKPKNDFTPKD